MRNVLPFRVAELEDRAPLVDWSIQLQFYAHEVDPGMTESLNISGVSVEISYVRFSDLAGLDTTSGLVGFLDTCLRNELNKIHVHPSIRQALLAMM
jgi:hypothetical protein